MSDPAELLIENARRLGFELAGIAAAERPRTFDVYRRRIEDGCHAGMDYLAARCREREHPESILPGVRSLLMLGVSYRTVLGGGDVAAHPVAQLAGIAEYARGADYHDWIRARLKILSQKHRELFPEARCRGTVDTVPLMERDFAARAGLGRIGKNTMLIHTDPAAKIGSKFFLAALLSTAELKPTETDSGEPASPCGECRRCLDACPTGALTAPYRLDARLCLNYWTIEHRGEIPREIRQKLGNRFFGCDTCQAVCPWNRDVGEIPPGTVDPQTLAEEELRRIARNSSLRRRFS